MTLIHQGGAVFVKAFGPPPNNMNTQEDAALMIALVRVAIAHLLLWPFCVCCSYSPKLVPEEAVWIEWNNQDTCLADQMQLLYCMQ